VPEEKKKRKNLDGEKSRIGEKEKLPKELC
jgi:hypothetical protein